MDRNHDVINFISKELYLNKAWVIQFLLTSQIVSQILGRGAFLLADSHKQVNELQNNEYNI